MVTVYVKECVAHFASRIHHCLFNSQLENRFFQKGGSVLEVIEKPKICHPGWWRKGRCWLCEPYVHPKPKAMLNTVMIDDERQTMLYFCCPGCAEIYGDDGLHTLPINSYREWKFTGTLNSPSIVPSIDTEEGDQRCHLYLTKGIFIYERDSTHSMSGQSVPIPDLPDWVIDMLSKKEG